MSAFLARRPVVRLAVPATFCCAVALLAGTGLATAQTDDSSASQSQSQSQSQSAASASPVAGAPSGSSKTSNGDVLKVCASTQEAPYSTKSEDGFENRIATILAESMGRTLEYQWIDDPAIYLVRDGLSEMTCDVLIGVDADDERLATSQPYYRSAYAFVSQADAGFDGTRWQDVGADGLTRFATGIYSPAETMLRYADKYEDNLNYLYSLVNFKSRRNQYIDVPPSRLAQEVSQGNADLAIAFAPAVARYVTDSDGKLALSAITNDIELQSGRTIQLQYDQAVGVRHGDEELLREIDAALEESHDEITAVLEEEGIPLLPMDDDATTDSPSN